MKLSYLLLAVFVTFAFSNGANCQGQASGNGLLSLEDIDGAITESAQTEFLSGFAKLRTDAFAKLINPNLQKTFFGKKIEAPFCQDKLVCEVDCRDFFPNCKNYKQYMETKTTDDAEDKNVYSKVCVQRWYEDPKESHFFNNVLIPTLKRWNQDFAYTTDFTTFQQFEDQVTKSFSGKPGFNALLAIINYAKLYRSFQKLCQMNADWASKIDAKITSFENGPIPNEPSGIDEIRQKAKSFENSFNQEVAPVGGGFFSIFINMARGLQRTKYSGVRQSMREAYKFAIIHGDAPICKCRGFKRHHEYTLWFNSVLGGKKFWFFTFPMMSTPNYLNNIYPPREVATRNFCASKC